MEQGLHLVLAFRLIDPKDLAAIGGGAQGDQQAVLLLLAQSGQMVLPEGRALLQGVVAVATPKHKAHGNG